MNVWQANGRFSGDNKLEALKGWIYEKEGVAVENQLILTSHAVQLKPDSNVDGVSDLAYT